MGLIRWFKRGAAEHQRRRHEWREACSGAIEQEDGARLGELRAEVVNPQPDEDVELELEMLDALEQVAHLRVQTEGGTLPTVDTHHRVIGAERCHFSAPASVPDDPAQPSGRVLYTPTRTLFVGAGKTSVTPWHSVHHVIRTDRDLLLARADGAGGVRFRFNTFADAAIAAALARRLKGRR